MNDIKVFDLNIHLPPLKITETAKHIDDEIGVSPDDLINTYNEFKNNFCKNLDNLNIMIFNSNIISSDQKFDEFSKIVRADFPDSIFTILLDFRTSPRNELIDKSLAKGFKSIKFHSYIQKISESDFGLILKLCQYASSKNMFICIDCSYGTSQMYDYDNLKLAASIAENITNTPIVLLHSGGARVIEAMLLAEDKKNIFLETSFTLPYYMNSSVETDLAFSYKKIGTHRVLYASDFPYIKLEDSINTALQFFEKHGFSSQETENIFYHNALNLLNAC